MIAFGLEAGDDAAGDVAAPDKLLVGVVDVAESDFGGDEVVEVEAALQVEAGVHGDVVLEVGRAHAGRFTAHADESARQQVTASIKSYADTF